MSEFLNDYDYVFPKAAVAQEPLADRAASRLLCLSREDGRTCHRLFREVGSLLREGDLLVVNDTSVLPSRLYARKPTGGLIEVFLVRAREGGEWEVFLSPTRGLQEGSRLRIVSRAEPQASGPEIEVLSLGVAGFRIRFRSSAEGEWALRNFGEMPLPPYIERHSPQASDRERYQTVFAARPGAVAAPTAGLHFTPEILSELRSRGIGLAKITLHVGPGTFLPVKTERIEEHEMHAEFYRVPIETQEAIALCRERGGRVLAVGTTSLRSLESWAACGEAEGETRLFVRPGFEFRVVQGLLTNFHQPKSTLLMLVSALAGRERVLSAYREAIGGGYRLFSYGDCMLIL